VVAVNDFNMGAMENKGLNIFNSKYVLALPDTATDDDYEGIETVIAHEYFHNWTGNRVTCRDWFQLTLKEGLTVYRDQRFSEDMISMPVCRIAGIKDLRSRQFPEDEGPMAHPIRPDSYISMENFYTATVYDKGAEVIRMYATLLGTDGFRKGMDLYFDRHDGQAVTCDDFRASMSDANGRDLSQFERWYSQAGTPRLRAAGDYDAEQKRYVLTLSQDYPETAFEIVGAALRQPLHLPVAVGLLGSDGSSMSLRLEGDTESEPAATTRVLELRESVEQFVFEDIAEEPVPSILRGFSAPVRFEMDRGRESLAFLMAHDEDPVNRWDAGQQLALEWLVSATQQILAGKTPELDAGYSSAWGRLLGDENLDGSLRALALTLPGELVVAQELDVIEPDAIHEACGFLRVALARAHSDQLWSTYRGLAPKGPYRHERSSIDRRRLRNAALYSLASTADEEAIEAAWSQFQAADNMTDAQAAFVVLSERDHARREEVTSAFYDRWHEDPLVIDKWFAIQAGSSRPDTLERVRELTRHPDFNLGNPNRVRSLIAAFCAGNQVRFHASSGEGYLFLADYVLALDDSNPQLASRMVSSFNSWRRYDMERQALMQTQLERIASSGSLSNDVYEIVNRALSR
ncbi:MAG: aminopeptidase N, partial [Proteobacteria bacterium]|nr:aminopeptidase N [Pseudomonadota bacterium]